MEFFNRVKEKEDPEFYNYKTGAIEMKNVTFKYAEKNKNVLEDFSMKINGKETTFIVGESGIGKSSLFNLIVNPFYE